MSGLYVSWVAIGRRPMSHAARAARPLGGQARLPDDLGATAAARQVQRAVEQEVQPRP
jgi:hypothetical protein